MKKIYTYNDIEMLPFEQRQQVLLTIGTHLLSHLESAENILSYYSQYSDTLAQHIIEHIFKKRKYLNEPSMLAFLQKIEWSQYSVWISRISVDDEFESCRFMLILDLDNDHQHILDTINTMIDNYDCENEIIAMLNAIFNAKTSQTSTVWKVYEYALTHIHDYIVSEGHLFPDIHRDWLQKIDRDAQRLPMPYPVIYAGLLEDIIDAEKDFHDINNIDDASMSEEYPLQWS